MTAIVSSHNFCRWPNTDHIFKGILWSLISACSIDFQEKGWKQEIVGFCDARRKTTKKVTFNAYLFHSTLQFLSIREMCSFVKLFYIC